MNATWKGRAKGFLLNSALLAVSLVVCVAVLEFVVSHYLWWGKPELDPSIPFRLQQAPNARFSLHGAVFAYDSQHNSDGFRERELPSTRYTKGKRVVFIGDSYVYGWGVNNPDCFVRRAEKRLKEADGDAAWDVLNLGVFGTQVLEYRDTLFSYGRQLQPDLVVVCLYLPNDAAYWYTEPKRKQPPGVAARFLRRLYPERTIDLVTRAYRRLQHSGVDMAAAPNRNPLTELIESDDPIVREKVNRIDPALKEMCLNWELNPFYAAHAITREPDLLADHIETNNRNIRNPFPWRVLKEMRDEVEAWGGELRFVFIPMGRTIERAQWPGFEKLGYTLREGLLNEHRIQDTYAAYANDLGIPFLDVRPYVQNQPARVYLDLDDHLTIFGHRLLALTISDWLLGKPMTPPVQTPGPPRRPAMQEIQRWDFSSGLGDWTPEQPSQHVEAKDGHLALTFASPNAAVRNPVASLDCADVNRFRVRMKANRGRYAQLFWGQAPGDTEKKSFSEKRVAVFPIVADDQYHEYDIALEHAVADYSGVWSELSFQPAAMELKESDTTGANVEIEWIALGHCEPNPEPPNLWDVE